MNPTADTPPTQEKKTVQELIAEGATLKEEIKVKSARLKEIDAELVTHGAGKYEGGGRSVLVIQPASSYTTPADIAAAKKLCGAAFSKLFTREIKYTPVKSFKDVVAALLTPAKAEKLLKLCEKAATAYAKW